MSVEFWKGIRWGLLFSLACWACIVGMVFAVAR